VDVKRLAAVDMHGISGSARRKRIVLAEFAVGLVVMTGLGLVLIVGSSSLGTRILGIWLAGAGLNYAPLLAYAIALSRAGALEAELAGVDAGQELRRYGVLQLWILVPLSLLAMAFGRRGRALYDPHTSRPQRARRLHPGTARPARRRVRIDFSLSSARVQEVEHVLQWPGG
jgi:hypothetical protein